MKINLVPLYKSSKNRQKIDKNEDLLFIDEINDYLIDEDLLILEDVGDDQKLFDIFLLGTEGNEKLFTNRYFFHSNPIVLLPSSRDEALSSALDIKTYLDNHGKPCFLLLGDAKHISNMLKDLVVVINAQRNIILTRLGMIGHPSLNNINATFDHQKIFQTYCIDIVKITNKQFDEMIEKGLEEMLDISNIAHAQELINQCENQEKLREELIIYVVLKNLVKEYDLKGITFNNHNLLKKYRCNGYLALSLLNEEGIAACLDNDICSLLTIYVANCLTNRTSFLCKPLSFNYDNYSVSFASYYLPLNIVSSFQMNRDIRNNVSFLVKGELPEGNVTLLKISPDHDMGNHLCIPATIKKGDSENNHYCTKITVSLQEETMLEMLKASYGGNVVIVYGDISHDFFPLLSLLAVK